MKIMIASDIHGSAYCCRKLLEDFEKEEAEKLLLLGDILYHGPRNDLPKEYNPKEVIELLNAKKEKILCVRGNCDTEVDQMVLKFPIMADYAIIYAEGRTIYATHGHKFNMNNVPPLMKKDILLHGHTHIPACEEFGNENIYINPGSVSIPKKDSQYSYIVFDGKKFVWKSLDREEYKSYEI
jgi:uncharacterized protein